MGIPQPKNRAYLGSASPHLGSRKSAGGPVNTARLPGYERSGGPLLFREAPKDLVLSLCLCSFSLGGLQPQGLLQDVAVLRGQERPALEDVSLPYMGA